MKIEVEISDKRINDLFFGHLGRVSPWLYSVDGEYNTRGEAVKVVYDREEDDEGTYKGRKNLLYVDFHHGLTKFANHPEYAHQWAQFINEDDDDVTFDVAWNFVIFGKVVFT